MVRRSRRLAHRTSTSTEPESPSQPSQIRLVECGACFDWFKSCGDDQDNDVQEEALQEKEKMIATIPTELSSNELLSKLGGMGYIFTCKKGLCSGCFYSYLITRLQEAKNGMSLTPLSCPLCRVLPTPADCISQDEIKAVFSSSEMEEYYRQLILGTFKQKFYCPNKECLSVFDAADAIAGGSSAIQENDTQVICPQCKKTACVECGSAWHSGFSCQEFKNRPLFIRDNADELAMELAKRKNWRQCPSDKCREWIELSDGCNHITCPCKKEFCYVCLSDWEEKKDARGNIISTKCSRLDKGGPACPLYTADSVVGIHQHNQHFRRHSVDWIRHDRINLPYQKSNTFTRHLLGSRRCGYCSAKFKHTNNLVKHLESTEHEVFDCCAKFYKTRIDFDSHVRNAHPGRQWVSGEVILRIPANPQP